MFPCAISRHEDNGNDLIDCIPPSYSMILKHKRISIIPNGTQNVDDTSLDHHFTLRGPTSIKNLPNIFQGVEVKPDINNLKSQDQIDGVTHLCLI